tara:strand:+ start:31 stop:552 length:522 start_codon:yes stop_codon:yes gene_type:complete
MSDIFDELDNDLSENKKKKSSDEVAKDKLNKEFDQLEDQVCKNHFRKDFEKFVKLIEKHKDKNSDISTYDKLNYLEVTRSQLVLDEYTSEQVLMETVLLKEPDIIFSILDLNEMKKYKLKESDFGLRVSLKGDEMHHPEYDYRDTLESKIFKIEDKEKGYKYFNDLLKKSILI